MGVWATGLYAGDFALDLRSTVRAVAKLPFPGDRLLEILCHSEPAAANQPDDPDHSTFWLVVADQFARLGIQNKRAHQTALAIIDTNADLAILQKSGMPPQDLRKRENVLREVRERLTAPPARTGPRNVIKKPQPLLMQTGDVLVYPTFGGRCRNPYVVDQNKDRMGTASPPWQIDSWAAMVVIDSGRAFDFLAWYRPLTLATATPEKPGMESLKGDLIWKLGRPGTCSAPHFKRVGLEKIGSIAIDRARLKNCFGELPSGTPAAVSDISLANHISVDPCASTTLSGGPGNTRSAKAARSPATITGLMQIVEP